jgi:hypothetical protein
MTDLAPIALFVFRRPAHTRQVLDSLAANREAADSTLYVFCDGAKQGASEDDLLDIGKVRQIVRAENRFAQTIIIERDRNAGLANSIISGVTQIVERHGTVIVVEDDLIVSPFFLKYMNQSLGRYQDNPRVGQIGACNFFACGPRYPQSFFIPIPDCWGWGTWRDRWQHFEPNAVELLAKLEQSGRMRRFNVDGAYPMERMLRNQIDGKVDSWAIRWQAVCVLHDWWTLYPNPSMSNHVESLKNTHTPVNILPPIQTVDTPRGPTAVIEDPAILRAMRRGYAGVSHFDGSFNFTAGRAWLRYVYTQWILERRSLRHGPKSAHGG